MASEHDHSVWHADDNILDEDARDCRGPSCSCEVVYEQRCARFQRLMKRDIDNDGVVVNGFGTIYENSSRNCSQHQHEQHGDDYPCTKLRTTKTLQNYFTSPVSDNDQQEQRSPPDFDEDGESPSSQHQTSLRLGAGADFYTRQLKRLIDIGEHTEEYPVDLPRSVAKEVWANVFDSCPPPSADVAAAHTRAALKRAALRKKRNHESEDGSCLPGDQQAFADWYARGVFIDPPPPCTCCTCSACSDTSCTSSCRRRGGPRIRNCNASRGGTRRRPLRGLFSTSGQQQEHQQILGQQEEQQTLGQQEQQQIGQQEQQQARDQTRSAHAYDGRFLREFLEDQSVLQTRGNSTSNRSNETTPSCSNTSSNNSSCNNSKVTNMTTIFNKFKYNCYKGFDSRSWREGSSTSSSSSSSNISSNSSSSNTSESSCPHPQSEDVVGLSANAQVDRHHQICRLRDWYARHNSSSRSSRFKTTCCRFKKTRPMHSSSSRFKKTCSWPFTSGSKTSWHQMNNISSFLPTGAQEGDNDPALQSRRKKFFNRLQSRCNNNASNDDDIPCCSPSKSMRNNYNSEKEHEDEAGPEQELRSIKRISKVEVGQEDFHRFSTCCNCSFCSCTTCESGGGTGTRSITVVEQQQQQQQQVHEEAVDNAANAWKLPVIKFEKANAGADIKGQAIVLQDHRRYIVDKIDHDPQAALLAGTTGTRGRPASSPRSCRSSSALGERETFSVQGGLPEDQMEEVTTDGRGRGSTISRGGPATTLFHQHHEATVLEGDSPASTSGENDAFLSYTGNYEGLFSSLLNIGLGSCMPMPTCESTRETVTSPSIGASAAAGGDIMMKKNKILQQL
ncbi:unnamed protein product [Amoebophrya sp. A25]|nr:unnamed protein product [Amoebophrya sp. A25]|eukprot:GSA25T00014903001.1